MSGDDIEEGNQKRFPENKNIKKKGQKKKNWRKKERTSGQEFLKVHVNKI
jgi:hypothetical protein